MLWGYFMTVDKLIENFSVNVLTDFFIDKIETFKKVKNEDYEYLFEDNEDILKNYKDIIKIGEADLINTVELIVIAAKTEATLTNRTGKKRQYDIAKKILKEEDKDAAFFIFYDNDGNFRFSLIRVNFHDSSKDFTDFRRYTYYVSPKQTNKTFKSQISKCNFNSLDSIQEAFKVKPITKEFYEKLQHWYFWAIKNVKFPEDAEKETNGREIAIIRLITRIMFIWFMKVRKLIPDNLFDEGEIRKILKDFSEKESTYYKAILQNLFFATLNTKQEERKFRSEKRGYKGYNSDYGNQNVFRYHDLFKDNVSLKELFEKIPFLNGGLFECLDYRPKGKNKDEKKYIDGFTATKSKQPIIPNFLFFSDSQKIDLSEFYDKKFKNKTFEVEGLINLLKNYNFTIDENEPDDIEIALDPELLGSIFENLLASYNPETATTARKATGSFYTPREIVDYMTTESLKQYFKTNLTDISDIDEKLDTLINARDFKNPFDEGTTKQLIKLINDLRVVDPAVGSGAFPMAMLNRLVFILSKLDPKNKYWKQSQIEAVETSVNDPTLQRKLIEQIERQFKEKNADYGRKLYLIERCIYGVDIQQIAVEIAKLRFFISLLVDEEIDFDKPNYGIEPLPNLDFKLMQGNSLISTYAGIDFNDKRETTTRLFSVKNKHYKKLIEEFKKLKHQYQNEADPKKKKDLRAKIDKAIIKIFEEKISEIFPELNKIEDIAKQFPKEEQQNEYIRKGKKRLIKELGFDIEQIEKDLIAYTEGRKAKDFFLWNVYFAEVFAEKGGFDIVIGNPPYGAKILKNELKIIKSKLKNTNNSNSAALFIDYSKNKFVNSRGTLSFIVPKSILFSEKWLSLAKSLSEYTSILADAEVAFDNVLLEQVLFVFNKSHKVETYKAFKYKDKKFHYRANIKIDLLDVFEAWICDVNSNECEVGYKIKNENTVNLGVISETKRGMGLQKYLQDNGEISVIGGKEISRYKINGIKGFLQKNILDSKDKKIKFLKQVKIVSQDLIAHIQKPNPHIKITSMIDRNGVLIGMDTVQNTVINNKNYSEEFILSLLNSKLINWYTYRFIYCSAIRTMHFDNYYIGKIPIKRIQKSQQKPFENLVNKIISKKEAGEDTTAEEHQIDIMVYKLYDLTYDEVKIVDPEFDLTKEEYDYYEW